MSASDPERALQIAAFASLFRGYPTAYGTGDGGWVHKKPTIHEYAAHVAGKGPGLGIGPLLPDGTCWFAAIDLDRPDFELAQSLMKLLPGTTWLERSRSGNAHILAFFAEPIEAWVTRGIMREALAAYNERSVEVFPKSDMLHPGMVGNYLNLPYFGDTRPVIGWKDSEGIKHPIWGARDIVPFSKFVHLAAVNGNSADEWRKRAHWLGVPSPQEREASQARTFGQSATLHRCAAHIIEHRDDHPVREGYRAAVYFALSCQLANWSEIDREEALGLLALVNDASPDPISSAELQRIYSNAERGQFTSTRCDDPLVISYADPECPIVRKA